MSFELDRFREWNQKAEEEKQTTTEEHGSNGKPPKVETLYTLCQRHLSHNKGDIEKTVDAVAKEIYSSEALFQAVVHEIVDVRVRSTIHSILSNERYAQRMEMQRRQKTPHIYGNSKGKSFKERLLKPGQTPAATTQTQEQFDRMINRMLMDFPLGNGKRLGDATKEDLLRYRESCTGRMKTYGFYAAWSGLIADTLPDFNKTPVKQVHTEDSLTALKKHAEASAGSIEL